MENFIIIVSASDSTTPFANPRSPGYEKITRLDNDFVLHHSGCCPDSSLSSKYLFKPRFVIWHNPDLSILAPIDDEKHES